jgi:hypothetical protein
MRIVACALLLVAAVTACAAPEATTSSAVPADAPQTERLVFLALGGDESDDPPSQSDAARSWSQQVFVTLPTQAVLVDLGERGITAAQAVRQQLPRAQAMGPTTATVWLGAGDVEAGTDPDTFTDELTTLIAGLQEAGATRVLLLTRTNPGKPGVTDPAAALAPRVWLVGGRTGSQVVPLSPSGTGELHQDAVAARVRARLAR